MRTFRNILLLGILLLSSNGLIFANENLRFTLLATGEEIGYLAPCGCTKGQLGGIARRASYLEMIEKAKEPFLLVNNGDIAGGVDRQAEIKYEIAALAMDTMGYAAHNIGEQDIFLGVSFLKNTKDTAKLNFLSANICSTDGELLFEPFVISEFPHKSGRLKVGIVGVISKSFESEVKDIEDGLIIVDPASALKPIVEELDSKCDCMILLAHTEDAEAKQLANCFPKLDVIISGHGRDEPYWKAVQIGKTTILNTGQRGKCLIRLDLTFDAQRRIVDRQYKVARLGREYADSKKMTELLTLYHEILRTEDLLNKKRKRSTLNGDEYAGAEECRNCHEDEYSVWRKSVHAKASQTLIDKRQQYDPECVQCHVVGYDYKSGFKNYTDTPRLANVGCESCHGPMKEHTIHPQKPRSTRIGRKTCLQCHDGDHSPGFRYEQYLAEITHNKTEPAEVRE